MISVGIITVTIHHQKQFKNHYSKINNFNSDSITEIELKIKEVLKPSLFHIKYVGVITKVNHENTSGKVLINIEKDTNFIPLKVDDILFTKTQLQSIPNPLNPYQFNYKKYLEKKYIFHQLYLTKNKFIKVDSSKHTIYGYAALLREQINSKLDSYHLNPEVLSIVNALILGQRQDISKETYERYTQAGAVHILAVSGLHVGIILLLLNRVFKPLELFRKGKILKVIIIIILLWCYAIIAGLSASVTRAVAMFMLFAIALNLKRPTNVYNTLAISMFLLLLAKPSFLFDVGFQLSYLAVLAIISIEPMLSSLWKPRFKLTNFFWRIFKVTLAAQIGVLPISLFYFHQFPGLFFISNLVIIPFLSVILGLGITIILLALFNSLPTILTDIYSYIILSMNEFINWVSNQEAFLFQNISFNIWHVLFSYIIITLTIIYIKQHRFRTLVSILVLIVCFQGYLLFKTKVITKNEFIVFHKTRHTILGFRENEKLNIHHNNSDEILSENSISSYAVRGEIAQVEIDSIESVYKINNKFLLVIDSLGVYNSKSFKPDFILLRNSPKVNLIRLIDSLQPDLIISDGSNYKSYQERWKESCEEKKIPFHRTSEKGAFIFKY